MAETYQSQPELHQSGACGCPQLSAHEFAWQEEAPWVDHCHLLALLQRECCQLVPSQQVKFHDPVSIAMTGVLLNRRLLIMSHFARIGQSNSARHARCCDDSTTNRCHLSRRTAAEEVWVWYETHLQSRGQSPQRRGASRSS